MQEMPANRLAVKLLASKGPCNYVLVSHLTQHIVSQHCPFGFCFFLQSGDRAHKEFVLPGQTVNQIFIGKSFKDSGKGWHVCNLALHAHGCCTTTTPHVTRQTPSMNFWQKNVCLCFFSPPIRWISVPVTSFYSLGSKTT